LFSSFPPTTSHQCLLLNLPAEDSSMQHSLNIHFHHGNNSLSTMNAGRNTVTTEPPRLTTRHSLPSHIPVSKRAVAGP
jgi:hypothetical protein